MVLPAVGEVVTTFSFSAEVEVEGLVATFEKSENI